MELSPEEASRQAYFKQFIAKKIKISEAHIREVRITRKSIDARRKKIRINIAFQVFIDEEPPQKISWQPSYRNVEHAREVLISGWLVRSSQADRAGYEAGNYRKGKTR